MSRKPERKRKGSPKPRVATIRLGANVKAHLLSTIDSYEAILKHQMTMRDIDGVNPYAHKRALNIRARANQRVTAYLTEECPRFSGDDFWDFLIGEIAEINAPYDRDLKGLDEHEVELDRLSALSNKELKKYVSKMSLTEKVILFNQAVQSEHIRVASMITEGRRDYILQNYALLYLSSSKIRKVEDIVDFRKKIKNDTYPATLKKFIKR